MEGQSTGNGLMEGFLRIKLQVNTIKRLGMVRSKENTSILVVRLSLYPWKQDVLGPYLAGANKVTQGGHVVCINTGVGDCSEKGENWLSSLTRWGKSLKTGNSCGVC